MRQITVTLSTKEVEEIIKKHLEKEGYEIKSVDFNIQEHFDQFDQGCGFHKLDSIKCSGTKGDEIDMSRERADKLFESFRMDEPNDI